MGLIERVVISWYNNDKVMMKTNQLRNLMEAVATHAF